MLTRDPLAPTSMRDPTQALNDHLADSLVALELAEVRAASRIADLGAGAGLPGLPLAIALPSAEVDLVESNRRKCEFIARAAGACGLSNVEVVNRRAEEWPEGIGRFDLVTARALAPLPVVAEYAAPLLRIGGRWWPGAAGGTRATRPQAAPRPASWGSRSGEIVRGRALSGRGAPPPAAVVKVAETPAGSRADRAWPASDRSARPRPDHAGAAALRGAPALD